MLANRTINEFAGFVSSAIFGQEDTPEKVFVNKQKDLFPFKENTAIEDEFIIWSELFRRYYEVDR